MGAQSLAQGSKQAFETPQFRPGIRDGGDRRTNPIDLLSCGGLSGQSTPPARPSSQAATATSDLTASASFTDSGTRASNSATSTPPPPGDDHPSNSRSSDYNRTVVTSDNISLPPVAASPYQTRKGLQPPPTAVQRRTLASYKAISDEHGEHQLNRAVMVAAQRLAHTSSERLTATLRRENKRLNLIVKRQYRAATM